LEALDFERDVVIAVGDVANREAEATGRAEGDSRRIHDWRLLTGLWARRRHDWRPSRELWGFTFGVFEQLRITLRSLRTSERADCVVNHGLEIVCHFVLLRNFQQKIMR